MSNGNGELMTVKIVRNDKGSPAGKLADAEVIFEAGSGPFNGLKLIGFAVWERRSGEGRNVTFPSRVFRKRRTPQLRTAAPRKWRGRSAERDSAVHPRRVHPHRASLLTRSTGSGGQAHSLAAGQVPRNAEQVT